MVPEVMRNELIKKGLHIQKVYGQTENPFVLLLPKQDSERKIGSVGLPGFFTKVWISDKTGRELSSGEIGEIVVEGPTIVKGYWRMPHETKQSIVNGVFHTGDLGYKDKEGYFYLTGRLKNSNL